MGLSKGGALISRFPVLMSRTLPVHGLRDLPRPLDPRWVVRDEWGVHGLSTSSLAFLDWKPVELQVAAGHRPAVAAVLPGDARQGQGLFVPRQGHVGRAVPIQPFAKILSLDILLGDEVHAVDTADFVNLHNVGVHQRRCRLSFVMKSTNVRLIACQGPLQDFQSYLTIQRFLLRQIDIGHSPAT